MNTKDVTVLVWDDPSNFNSNETKRSFGDGNVFKSLKQFKSKKEFERIFKELPEEENLVFCCHVKLSDFSLFEEFKYSGILNKYNIPNVHFLSSDATKANEKFEKKFGEIEKILFYNIFITKIQAGEIKTFTKKSLIQNGIEREKSKFNLSSAKYPHFEYALITALYEEFKEVKEFVDFPEKESFKIGCNKFLTGYLKEDKSKKLIASIPPKTGMVDAAILSTLMLEFFTPDYLMMSGVCGGCYDINIGDIVVANSVFTFQKGKISDIYDKNKNNEHIKIQLYDNNKNKVDYDHLFDKSGNQITISIEKFERELDHIPLEYIITELMHKKDEIELSINNTIKGYNSYKKDDLKIHIEPIACSTMVINKDGYFEDTIRSIDRKTVAVEMESYGLARACKIANSGKTKAIIFKSVMDNTRNKNDIAKRYAARTSALFLKELFLKKII